MIRARTSAIYTLYEECNQYIIQRHDMLGQCYANDTQLYCYCRPDPVSPLLVSNHGASIS